MNTCELSDVLFFNWDLMQSIAQSHLIPGFKLEKTPIKVVLGVAVWSTV